MKDLIKNYLENNINYNYKNVEITWILSGTSLLECGIECDDDFGGRKRIDNLEINVWEVLAFVNEKHNK